MQARPSTTISSTQKYRLYGSPDSANFVVRMVLEELGVPYDYVPVNRLESQQKSKEYRKLNPQGLLPVLEIPEQDAPVFETGAIMLLLADKHRSLAPTADSPQRGRFLKWLFFLSNTLHADLRIFFRSERYCSESGAEETLLTQLGQRIAMHFGQVEAEIETSGGPYLLGDQLSCLDFYLAACARWARVYGNGKKWSPEKCPCVLTLLALLECRPAIRRASEMEHIEGFPFTKPVPVTLPGVTA